MQVITSPAVLKFYNRSLSRNENSAKTYHKRLKHFERFTEAKYQIHIDELIEQLKNKTLNVYDILADFVIFLNKQNKLTPVTISHIVSTTKRFLVYHDIDIVDLKFDVKVALPRVVRMDKEALDKKEIVNILNSCSNISIKTYLMLLASTGLRGGEALSIRAKDIDFESDPARINIRGEFTKTGRSRYVFITQEMYMQLRHFINYKHRRRRFSWQDEKGYHSKYLSPEVRSEDLIFSTYHQDNRYNAVKPLSLYTSYAYKVEQMLDRIGKGQREESNNKRRKYTLHSFRRWVKSVISDLGYSDFSEWFIGHSGSTYWRKKDSDKAELFRKIEPYLTYLDQTNLEARGADIETKLEERDNEIQALRYRESLNTDAIAVLSDKVTKLILKLNTHS